MIERAYPPIGAPSKGYIINGACSSALESGPNGISGPALE
jgi:hypothetical protein